MLNRGRHSSDRNGAVKSSKAKPIRPESQPRRLRRAVLALAAVLLVGTVGFMIIEPDWGIWKAMFFTVITVSTVGYDDGGISPVGQHFAVLMILIGMSTVSYALGQIVHMAVDRHFGWRNKMQQQIDHINEHFIICGVGHVGKAVCERFAEASMPVVVVEKDAEVCTWVRSRGHLTVEGTAVEDEFLLRAGIKRAKGIVCSTGSDAENLVVTLTACELNPAISIICRINDLSTAQKFRRAGATHVVSPATNGGNDIANMLIRPNLARFLEVARDSESGFQMTEVAVEPGSPLVGKSLDEFSSKHRSLVFVAIQHHDGRTQLRPEPNESFHPGDVVIIVGNLDTVLELTEQSKAQSAAA